VFLPLFSASIVILPLRFKVCEFTLAFSKRMRRLPLVLMSVRWDPIK
jgi:hypothetical protein